MQALVKTQKGKHGNLGAGKMRRVADRERFFAMTPNDVRDRLRAENFVPLRVVMNSGQTYEIRVAEFAVVTLSALYIFPMLKPGSDIAQGPPVVCSLRNIATLEPLAERAA